MSQILLVDDDEDMMMLTAMWLKRAGHDVATVTSGEAALNFLKAEKPQLILLDYAMPGMDGPATFKAIREDRSLDDIPVVFRTGKEEEDIDSIKQELSPDGVIPKSWGKPKFMKAVEAALA